MRAARRRKKRKIVKPTICVPTLSRRPFFAKKTKSCVIAVRITDNGLQDDRTRHGAHGFRPGFPPRVPARSFQRRARHTARRGGCGAQGTARPTRPQSHDCGYGDGATLSRSGLRRARDCAPYPSAISRLRLQGRSHALTIRAAARRGLRALPVRNLTIAATGGGDGSRGRSHHLKKSRN